MKITEEKEMTKQNPIVIQKELNEDAIRFAEDNLKILKKQREEIDSELMEFMVNEGMPKVSSTRYTFSIKREGRTWLECSMHGKLALEYLKREYPEFVDEKVKESELKKYILSESCEPSLKEAYTVKMIPTIATRKR